MKYLIAFLLLVFAPNFAPYTAFAITNSTQVGFHSTVSTPKKLTFKEKLLRRLYKKENDPNAKADFFLIIGILLLLIGIVLFVVSENKSKAAASSSSYAAGLAGLGESVGGILLSTVGFGFLLSGIFRKRRIAKSTRNAS